MKKISKLLFIFLLGFIFVPMVHAADISKTGVTYFLMYPNGEEEVTENYNNAVNAGEKLIYTATTNAAGEVPICGWNAEGTIRVVQHVPDGYTTNEREITVDLSKGGDASFIDYRGLGNPKTGRSLLFLAVVAGVAGITIAARKNKKSLLVVPVLVVATVVMNANAKVGCPSITVKDGNGNPLKGVQIDIYAKPTVDAQPAAKFDANGGHFLDGKTVMYLRIPHNGSTMNDIADYNGDEIMYYFDENSYGAYREGYYPDDFDYPDSFDNGTTVYMLWYEDSDAELIKLIGNGGTYDFHGQPLSELTLYTGDNPYSYGNKFENGDNYYIGLDDNAACSHYTSTGTYNEPIARDSSDILKRETVVETYYACWNSKPDGIYVNENKVFIGTTDTCFYQSYLGRYDESTIGLMTNDNDYVYELIFDGIDSEDVAIFFRHNLSEKKNVLGRIEALGTISGGASVQSDTINKLEIIRNGKTILSLTASDLQKNNLYYLKNGNQAETLNNYLNELFDNNCFNNILASDDK